MAIRPMTVLRLKIGDCFFPLSRLMGKGLCAVSYHKDLPYGVQHVYTHKNGAKDLKQHSEFYRCTRCASVRNVKNVRKGFLQKVKTFILESKYI